MVAECNTFIALYFVSMCEHMCVSEELYLHSYICVHSFLSRIKKTPVANVYYFADKYISIFIRYFNKKCINHKYCVTYLYQIKYTGLPGSFVLKYFS